ncbi:MAG: nuclear transport factor 2 family protein [Actinobacteria bacterium]|nr:nuclear transport factor 2 family protein [Actinomycetota bacterium]
MAAKDETRARTAKPRRSRAKKTAARAPGEVARAGFDAVGAHDVDAILACWSPEGVQDWVALGVIRRGHDEIREMFEEIYAATPDFEMVVERIVADGETACVQWRSAGTFDGAPFMGIEPNGRRVELRGVDVMEIEEGLIVRNSVYYDGAAFGRAIGMLPPQDSPAERALYTAFNATTKLRRAIRERTQGAEA